MRMRDSGFGSDFDIFLVGSRSDMMRFAGDRMVCGSGKPVQEGAGVAGG